MVTSLLVVVVVLALLFDYTNGFHDAANSESKIVLEHFVTIYVILAGLIAAITWNLTTWWFGIPSSSSHTLIGGFAGAGITNAIYMGANGLSAIDVKLVLTTIAYIVLAPVIGLIIAYIVTIIILHICKRARPAV